tara:strand:+ start:414 stop:599 length:186 start_codon:yes stop_codon:yes gene_type:complete
LIVVVPVVGPPAFVLIARLVAAWCVPTAEFQRISRHDDQALGDDHFDRLEAVQVVSGFGFF